MTQTNKIKTESYRRLLDLGEISTDEETRSFDASLSSELIVKRWFGTEQLQHNDKAINMERAADGLTLLFNHDVNKPIGRAENIHLAGGKLRATLKFSNNPLAQQVFKDVDEGFIRGVSIGYRIEKYKDVKGGIVATRWAPFEASIATVEADHTVGVNRQLSDGENTMDNENTDTSTETIVQNVTASHQAGIAEGMRLEAERTNQIRDIFANFADNEKARGVMERCLSDYRITPDAARTELLNLLAGDFEPTTKAKRTQPTVEREEIDKFAEQAENAIAVRAGVETDDKVIAATRAGDLMSFSLSQIAREFHVRQNMPIGGLDAMGIVGNAFRISGAHSSSDFPAILESVANKAMAKGYTMLATNWRQWAAVGSVSDFKQTNFITLSEFSDLELKPEGGEYKHGTLKDKKEQLGIATLGKMFSITREAIINDDLGALSRAPQAMGQAAGRSVEALAYATFLSNPTLLEDSKTVFHADHGNIGTAGAPSETTLDEMRQLMASQKGLLNAKGAPKGKASTQLLNIPAKYLMVPKAMELACNKLMVAEYATNDLSNPNMIRGAFEVIASAYLDADSTTAYYLLADQNQYDTVMVAFLNGNQSPYLESKRGWNVDGIEYKVRIDVGAGWLDYRGACYNAGA